MKRQKIRMLCEGGILVGLSAALSFIRIPLFPWGGAITLLSMLPVMLFCLKYGVGRGFVATFLFSLIQLWQGISLDGLLGWGLAPQMLLGSIFFDYIGAFSVLCLVGLCRGKGAARGAAGAFGTVFIRFLLHLCSGVIIFHSAGMLWEGFSTQNALLYSFLYNVSYMLPEMVLTAVGTAVMLKIPAVARLLETGES